uniref:Cna B-type domain-containing protein n=1 Tax=uncultured Methanobrevibacter sp. TaxID=253161 RepID=UPI0025EA90E6
MNNWKWTFPELDKYKNGELIVYTVNETAVANYTVNITQVGNDFTLNNTHVPELTEVNVTKIWDDNNDQDGVRPPSVTVILYADGTEINRTVLSEENNWKWTFPELDKYNNGILIVYTVNETAVANYTVNITQVGNDFTLNNTHVPELT